MQGYVGNGAVGNFAVGGAVGGSNIKSIQRGTVAPGATTTTIPISPVDPSKSIVLCYLRADNAGYSCGFDITDSTTLTLYKGTDMPYSEWAVIEFNQVKSFQKGTEVITLATPNTTVSAVPAITAVGPKAIMTMTTKIECVGSGGGSCSGRVDLVPAQVALSGKFQASAVATVYWRVLDFD